MLLQLLQKHWSSGRIARFAPERPTTGGPLDGRGGPEYARAGENAQAERGEG